MASPSYDLGPSRLVLCSLWFNSSMTAMEEKLRDGRSNAGVGINIGRHRHLFGPALEVVTLRFDDGSVEAARVSQNSRHSCAYLN